MAEPSAKSFMKLLERSGIVADDKLKSALSKLKKKFSGKVVRTPDLTTHLIDAGLLTEWHCEKLLAGKYKGFFLGKYKLLGHLGTGGMSSVFLAEHKLSGQRRAIKVLPRKKVPDKSYLDRFYREGKAAAALNHPNIVRIYDICNEKDTHYMVMEWVKGTDLYQIVKENGPMDFVDAAKAIEQAAIGLQHAHDRNMVHRDIKPANLLRTHDNKVKILDLGLALLRQDDEESLTILHNERVMGTADYLSPEQAVNSHEVDHRADIYSLGCTLYYLVTGHPPFPSGSLAQRIAMHQTQEPAGVLSSRADCPPDLVRAIESMMEKAPEDRPATCQQIESMMNRFVETGSIQPDQEISIDTAKRRTPNRPVSGPSTAPIGPGMDPSPAATARPGGFAIDVQSSSSRKSGHSKKNKNDRRSRSGQFAVDTVHGRGGDTEKVHSAPITLPSGRARKKKGIPMVVLAIGIAILFAILIAVLAIVNTLLVDPEATGFRLFTPSRLLDSMESAFCFCRKLC